MKELPIVFSTDDNYVLPLSVAIFSLLKHKPSLSNYKIYIFTQSLQIDNIETIKNVCGDTPIEFIDISDYLNGRSLPIGSGLPIAMYYRFFIPNVLPQYDKVLYFDCDILINGDISSLINIDMYDNILAANYMIVNNPNMSEHFNSGILLFNVRAYLENDICNKCLHYLDEHKDLGGFDEETLNEVCKGRVTRIPANLNYQTWYCSSKDTLEKVGINKVSDIKIFHFSDKPWKVRNSPFADLWWKTAKQMPLDVYRQIEEKYSDSLTDGINYGYYKYHFASKLGKTLYKLRKKIIKK